MKRGRIACFNEVAGWRVNFALLRYAGDYVPLVLKSAAEGNIDRLGRQHTFESIAASKVVRAYRCLMGCDSSHVSSFEALACRVLEGASISLERPAGVFREILSLKSLAPWSVIDMARIEFPLSFRMGREEDVWNGPCGSLDLEGYPVLCDAKSVVASPVIFDDALLVKADCPEILLVCYAPAAVARDVDARGHLGRLVPMIGAYRFVEQRASLPEKGVKE